MIANEILTTKTKRCPEVNRRSLFSHVRKTGLRLSVECPPQATVELGPYSPDLVADPTLCVPLITCGEGVGETSGDSIAISWLTVTKW